MIKNNSLMTSTINMLIRKKISMGNIIFSIGMIFLFLFYGECDALEPHEVLVVGNRNAARSVGLAKYYMKKREIPEDNLVLLWVTDKETCSREDYVEKVLPPIRRFLQTDAGKNIRCIVTLFGVPLKVSPPEYDEQERKELKQLTEKRDALAKEIDAVAAPEPDIVARHDKLIRLLKDFKIRHDKWASLDSELSFVKLESYPLSFWLPNPLYLSNKNKKKMAGLRDQVMMVSRLDGPDSDTVKRIIDDSIEVEKVGLSGNACFDARWKAPDDKKKVSGYALADKLIHRAYHDVKKSGYLEHVRLDDTGALFQSGDCPNTALYCGWYSLARYVDAFTWAKGSVGYHIASSECATLKAGNSQVWCKRMLEEGIAATVGPVGEPYVQSFPNSEIFFNYLLDGYLTLVECYYLSLPYISWKMVLIGDPLYRPFKAMKTATAGRWGLHKK